MTGKELTKPSVQLQDGSAKLQRSVKTSQGSKVPLELESIGA